MALAAAATLGAPCAAPAQVPEQRPVSLDDLARQRVVSEPAISPDGRWVAYTVTTTDTAADATQGDLWMTSWDGARTIQLTHSPDDEHTPRWSPDNRYLAFLSARDDDYDAEQVWLLDRAGGEAEKLTEYPGGVSDYVWSPDGSRLALVVRTDLEPRDTASEDDRPVPIVIDRFYFKQDGTGYLGTERQHLYLYDLSTGDDTILTPDDYDEVLPAWSPDGKRIAFVSKRHPHFDRDDNWDVWIVDAEPGATPRQLTTFEGADSHPDYGSRPAFSPDGRYVAYLQGGPPKLIYYGLQQLAVVPSAGGPARVLSADLDRNIWQPAWSPDGKSILFLLEDDRSTYLARVPAGGGKVSRLLAGRRFVSGFSVAPDGRIAMLSSTPDRPAELYAVERGVGRPLSHQNDDWLSELRLAKTEEISFPSDSGVEVHGLMLKPPDYVPGRRYPTILWLHGGPVYQFSNEFDLWFQLFASNGYVVVAPNPRGSSGRGQAWQKEIYADWGYKDGRDARAAADYAVASGVADPDRLGVGGWSYGGMLTNYVIAQDTRFRAAASGASISDILAGYGTDQYVREYEAELGRPWGHLEAWIHVSFPFLHADRIVTPTLFMCGDLDFNVPLLNSEQMYEALRSLGVETQLIIYPGEDHSIGRPSFVRDRLSRYLSWFGAHLKGDGATGAR